MENTLFDQSPRSTLDAPLSRSSMKSMSSSASFSSSSSSSSPYSSAASISHLLHNYNIPPAMPKINTVPNLYQSPIVSFSPPFLPQPNQAPLLPLPLYKNSSFPSPCNDKTISYPSTSRRKPRAPKIEPKPKVQTNKKKPQEKTLSTLPTSFVAVKLANTLDDLNDEVLIVSHAKNKDKFDRYSLSPPPSSLPLPGLSLLRHKTKINNSSNTEALIYKEVRSNGCSVDNGATDDLRRILHL